MKQPANELEWEDAGSKTTRPSDSHMPPPDRLGSIVPGLGPSSRQEKILHINCLELLAATLPVKTFLKNQENKRIVLLLDNQTAVVYINNLGGTVSAHAIKLERERWMWCIQRYFTDSAVLAR